jgi:hypothetical protein
MSFPWYTSLQLAAEANNVIGLRLTRMAFGGQDALEEAQLMVSEKIGAAWEAGTTLMSGGDVFAVIGRYREHVAANADRLAGDAADRS